MSRVRASGRRALIPVRPAAICVLVAVLVSGCGIAAKPLAGTSDTPSDTGFYGESYARRPVRVACLMADHLPAHAYRSADGLPALRIGTGPTAPTMIFEPSADAATSVKILGQAQGAELIGTVLLYPNGMSLSEAKVVERCAAVGVS